MRNALIVIALLLIASFAYGQANAVAHGAEKEAHEVAHPNERHGEGGEAPKTYFGIPGWILKLLNMLLFLGLLIYWVRGPVQKMFAERSESIRRELELARERRTKSDQMAADIQARLAHLEDELRSIRERAEAEGKRQRDELIAAAQDEAKKILDAARNEVDNKLKHARHELTEYAGKLASERAEAILRETITPADQTKLFEESLRQVGEVKA